MAKMTKNLEMTADVLLIAGGLNWGLVQWFSWNLVSDGLGFIPFVEPVVYSLVGASAVYKVLRMLKVLK